MKLLDESFDLSKIDQIAGRTCAGMYELIDHQEVFGENYRYAVPLWCSENGFICMFSPQRLTYVIAAKEGEATWEIL